MSLNPNFIEAVRRIHPGVSFRSDVILLDEGSGPFLSEWNLPGSPPTDAEIAAAMELPPQVTIDGAVFLSRITDAEYTSVMAAAASNVSVARWIEVLRMKGVVNTGDAVTIAAKAGLVALGLMTQDRADAVFAP